MPAHSDATPIIVGCGFVGKYLTNLLHTHSQSPICLVKSKTSLDTLNALGFNAQIFDLDSHDQHVDFNLAGQHIYYLAPPSNNDHRKTVAVEPCRSASLAVIHLQKLHDDEGLQSQ